MLKIHKIFKKAKISLNETRMKVKNTLKKLKFFAQEVVISRQIGKYPNPVLIY